MPFENIINNAKTYATYSKFKNNNSFFHPNYIRNFCNQRSNLRRLYQSTRDPSPKIAINRLNNKRKNLIQKEKEKNWLKFLENLSSDDSSLWRIKKKLNNNYTPIPPLISNNSTVYKDQDKDDCLANSHEKQF